MHEPGIVPWLFYAQIWVKTGPFEASTTPLTILDFSKSS